MGSSPPALQYLHVDLFRHGFSDLNPMTVNLFYLPFLLKCVIIFTLRNACLCSNFLFEHRHRS